MCRYTHTCSDSDRAKETMVHGVKRLGDAKADLVNILPVVHGCCYPLLQDKKVRETVLLEEKGMM